MVRDRDGDSGLEGNGIGDWDDGVVGREGGMSFWIGLG